jgi:hypothetical protein
MQDITRLSQSAQADGWARRPDNCKLAWMPAYAGMTLSVWEPLRTPPPSSPRRRGSTQTGDGCSLSGYAAAQRPDARSAGDVTW